MTPFSESQSKSVKLICLAGICLVILTALRCLPQISALLFDADGDDQMRLIEVRDWLAGQSWWDTRQYRVLPPEGISIHWSRYIDVGIGAILLGARAVLPVAQAELATVILWPSILASLMVLVLANGSSRLFGPAAALGALAVFFGWSKLGGEFVPARIDHHNVQILCATAIFYLSILPGRPRMLGALAGAVAALSLAIGLEMLPYLATIWGLMALRHAFGEPQSGDRLIGFGAAITLVAPLLMAGQTPMAAWGTPWCDVLATPVMALGLVGVAATLTPVLAERALPGPLPRIVVLLAITALGIWLAYPLLGQCLAGPYSAVSPEVRSIIENDITEAQSVWSLLVKNPVLPGRILLPPMVIAGLAAITVWRLRGRITPLQKTALVQAFVVTGVGLGFALLQIRAANLMTPAIPLLGGFLVHAFTFIPRESWRRLPAAVVLVLALPTVVERGTSWLALQATDHGNTEVARVPAEPVERCRNDAAMAEIASLPQSVIFTTLNLGPVILTYTQQSVTSAAYHRNPDALWNGVGAFENRETLQKALAAANADYLVLCVRDTRQRGYPLIKSLLAGPLPAWLRDVSGDRKQVRVLQVDKTALRTEGSS